MKILNACGMIFISTLALGNEIPVTDYQLSQKSYTSISLEGVYDGTFDPDLSYTKALAKNPALTQAVSYEKIATIETKSYGFDGVGSTDPFLLAARRRAAYWGANLLKYESGIEITQTKRTAGMTFTAYRVTFEGKLVDPVVFASLATGPWDSSKFKHVFEDRSAKLYPQETTPGKTMSSAGTEVSSASTQ